MDDNEFLVGEMIEIELCGIEAVIETVPDGDPLFLHIRDRLASLLNQLQHGQILAEHAEVQFEKMQEVLEQWRRDHPIPPD